MAPHKIFQHFTIKSDLILVLVVSTDQVSFYLHITIRIRLAAKAPSKTQLWQFNLSSSVTQINLWLQKIDLIVQATESS